MNRINYITLFCCCMIPITWASCSQRAKDREADTSSSLINPLLIKGIDPWATFMNGQYYYTQGYEDRIMIWKTSDITQLENAEKKEVWIPNDSNNAYHLWGPEIHFLNNKWYIYFSADDGNTDNHQIYVLENKSEDPFEGQFVMKGRIQTDAGNNWAIHASVFEHNKQLYMIWSGWQSRRIGAENQCIYIASMENPWTLSSDRIILSKPELEWERQWISPDGSRTAYPIYVNEAPQFFQSRNKDRVLIYYSASGRWTPYYSLGLLSANASSDLLNDSSWTKSPQPVFKQHIENNVYAPGGICFIPSPDGKDTLFIYHARHIENDPPGATDSRSPRIQKLKWDNNGIPVLGIPTAIRENNASN